MTDVNYEDEYQELVKNGWTVVSWTSGGGYNNRRKKGKQIP